MHGVFESGLNSHEPKKPDSPFQLSDTCSSYLSHPAQEHIQTSLDGPADQEKRERVRSP